MNTDEKLVVMANQIASFFASQGEARAVPAIADHLKKFWDPQMRRRLLNLDHAALHPLAKKAVPLLANPPAN